MAKKPKQEPKQESKVFSKEDISKYIPEDPIEKINAVMGFDLTTVFEKGVSEGAFVVEPKSGNTKAANVDALPLTKKKEK